jgi:hypothetical protein
MKQSEFIWFTKQNLKAEILQLDNSDVVVKPGGNILFIFENEKIKVRFVEFNENYIVPDKGTLRNIYDLYKKTNSESLLYKFCKEKLL